MPRFEANGGTRDACHVRSVPLLAALFVSAALAAAAEEPSRDAVDAALAPGYGQGDVAAAVRRLESALDRGNDEAEVRAWLARGWVTLGDAARAMDEAARAIGLNPLSGNAVFASSQALLLSGDRAAALELALDAIGRDDIDHGPGTRGALLLSAMSMLMARGDYRRAEALLASVNPRIAGLAGEAPPDSVERIGGPWHAIQALAAICRATGRPAEADRLAARLAPLTEEFFRSQDGGELAATSLWNLAATGAGRIPDDVAVRYLERAVDAGFVFDWRYNYAQHPALWPLRGNPAFTALLERLDAGMRRQHEEIGRSGAGARAARDPGPEA